MIGQNETQQTQQIQLPKITPQTKYHYQLHYIQTYQSLINYLTYRIKMYHNIKSQSSIMKSLTTLRKQCLDQQCLLIAKNLINQTPQWNITKQQVNQNTLNKIKQINKIEELMIFYSYLRENVCSIIETITQLPKYQSDIDIQQVQLDIIFIQKQLNQAQQCLNYYIQAIIPLINSQQLTTNKIYKYQNLLQLRNQCKIPSQMRQQIAETKKQLQKQLEKLHNKDLFCRFRVLGTIPYNLTIKQTHQNKQQQSLIDRIKKLQKQPNKLKQQYKTQFEGVLIQKSSNLDEKQIKDLLKSMI